MFATSHIGHYLFGLCPRVTRPFFPQQLANPVTFLCWRCPEKAIKSGLHQEVRSGRRQKILWPWMKYTGNEMGMLSLVSCSHDHGHSHGIAGHRNHSEWMNCIVCIQLLVAYNDVWWFPWLSWQHWWFQRKQVVNDSLAMNLLNTNILANLWHVVAGWWHTCPLPIQLTSCLANTCCCETDFYQRIAE